MAQERCESIGATIGYQIRLESKKSHLTRVTFCTTGVLLRRLQGRGKLAGVSHIIVDEVHERNLDSDFLLIILKDVLPNRPDLKLVLMSATINAELFSSYFGGCPVLTIPGFTHPVDDHFLEDVVEMTEYSIEEGSPYAVKADARARGSNSAEVFAAQSAAQGGDRGISGRNGKGGIMSQTTALYAHTKALMDEQVCVLALHCCSPRTVVRL